MDLKTPIYINRTSPIIIVLTENGRTQKKTSERRKPRKPRRKWIQNIKSNECRKIGRLRITG